METFKDKVRTGKVVPPTKRGYSDSKWSEAWAAHQPSDDNDQALFQAGPIIYSILQALRTQLNELYSQAPEVSNEMLLSLYFALSNRDRVILRKQAQSLDVVREGVFSVTLPGKLKFNELTLQEIADTAVDGLSFAIRSTINRKRSDDLVVGNGSLSIMEFIEREAAISNLYGVVESYWNAILWGDYRFETLNMERNVHAVIQSDDKLSIGAEYSQIRKMRLIAQRGSYATLPRMLEFSDASRYVTIKKDGRRKRLVAKDMRNAPDEVRYANSAWMSEIIFLSDDFPKSWLSDKSNKGFSIEQCLEVFRCLVLLAQEYDRRYPENNEVTSSKKLSVFCPVIKKVELIASISAAVDLGRSEVKEILQFLEYCGDTDQDLWCHPITSVSCYEYALLTSSLVAPVPVRLVEHWLVSLGQDLQSKGAHFEDTTLTELNRALKKCTYVTDYAEACTFKLSVGSETEEIDLACRIAGVILLGEIKSIVTTDSPISQYRTYQTLEHASNQILRKSKLFKDNISSAFEQLGWAYDESEEYQIVICIVNSGKIYAGSQVQNVPVTDLTLLCRYFEDSIAPLLSHIDYKTQKTAHLAWYELYDSPATLADNLAKYLALPPHLENTPEYFERKVNWLPGVEGCSSRLAYIRHVPKTLTAQDRVKFEKAFTIRTAKNFEAEAKNMDIVF